MVKLAATGPAFYYPLEPLAAEQLHDDILRVSCGLNPDWASMRFHLQFSEFPIGSL